MKRERKIRVRKIIRLRLESIEEICKILKRIVFFVKREVMRFKIRLVFFYLCFLMLNI